MGGKYALKSKSVDFNDSNPHDLGRSPDLKSGAIPDYTTTALHNGMCIVDFSKQEQWLVSKIKKPHCIWFFALHSTVACEHYWKMCRRRVFWNLTLRISSLNKYVRNIGDVLHCSCYAHTISSATFQSYNIDIYVSQLFAILYECLLIIRYY